jgi:hypothetical protein
VGANFAIVRIARSRSGLMPSSASIVVLQSFLNSPRMKARVPTARSKSTWYVLRNKGRLRKLRPLHCHGRRWHAGCPSRAEVGGLTTVARGLLAPRMQRERAVVVAEGGVAFAFGREEVREVEVEGLTVRDAGRISCPRAWKLSREVRLTPGVAVGKPLALRCFGAKPRTRDPAGPPWLTVGRNYPPLS